MRSRAQLLGGGVLVLLGVSGCPVTDDYFIDPGHAVGGGAGGGETGGGAQTSNTAGTAAVQGGTAGDVAVTTGGVTEMPTAGAPAAGQPADAGAGGMPTVPCMPTTERCNGHDDNCNDVVDELACNSAMNGTTGCSGFVLPSSPNHGYMLCTTGRKDWSHARDACEAQGMRLAWLETSDENTEVSKKIAALSTDADVLFGATDAANESYWFWYRGAQFWQGGGNGKPSNGAFSAWGSDNPNGSDGEDCGVLHPMAANWSDRPCSVTYAYLCEEPN